MARIIIAIGNNGKYCAECKLKRNGGRCLQFGQLEWCVDDLGGFIRHADCLEAEIVEAEKV